MNNRKQFLGVCVWLSDNFGLDLGGVRIVFMVGILFFGLSPLLYFLLYLIKPKKY